MARYQIGDRVEAIVNRPDRNWNIMIGDTGTVCDLEGDRVGVDWDNKLEEGMIVLETVSMVMGGMSM